MKERFEQIALKINQLPEEEQFFILRLIDFVEAEIEHRAAIIAKTVKRCGKCRKVKPRSEFYPRKTGGVRSVCKKCNRY